MGRYVTVEKDGGGGRIGQSDLGNLLCFAGATTQKRAVG